MAEVGVKVLKNRLSEYLRRVRQGERIVVTDRGVPIAELRPPEDTHSRHLSKLEHLRSRGLTRPATNAGEPFVDWPDIRLPPGTAARLIDELRDETHEP